MIEDNLQQMEVVPLRIGEAKAGKKAWEEVVVSKSQVRKEDVVGNLR